MKTPLTTRILLAVIVTLSTLYGVAYAKDAPDPKRDILVTFDNRDARATSGGLSAPYLHRKRYAIARSVRRDAIAIAKEHALTQVDHWPIKSLSIYCYVFRVPDGADREAVIFQLNADSRVETAQPLNTFETSTVAANFYDDQYANLQYGLDILDIAAAHGTSRGAGVRIAIVDSHVDRKHEDLKGRIRRIEVFANKDESADIHHGTAIASVIGAHSNNALGIVGIAPEAELELYVSCWSGGVNKAAICDSFSLSKALDTLLEDPPHVLNLSLVGPHDPLLSRLIQEVSAAGVVIVAAGSSTSQRRVQFPASMHEVIGVSSMPPVGDDEQDTKAFLYAPGDRILVAVPTDEYDFRSGSSLAAAHVSGVVALLLTAAHDQSPATIRDVLLRSQHRTPGSAASVNACNALQLSGMTLQCNERVLQSERNAYR